MYKNSFTGNIPDVVYSPSYYGSMDGILEVVDDSEDDVSLESYLFFDSIEYKTFEDLVQEIRSLLEKCHIFGYNINIQRLHVYDIITITTGISQLDILIPRQQNQMSIKRDYLFKRCFLNNRLINELSPIQKMSQLEIDMRNLS